MMICFSLISRLPSQVKPAEEEHGSVKLGPQVIYSTGSSELTAIGIQSKGLFLFECSGVI